MGTLPRGWLLALWLVVVGVAAVQTARLSLFMMDATKADSSILPGRPFFRSHSCLSAYTEACRLVSTGVNIYDPTVYGDAPGTPPRFLGPLKVDAYQYPPTFLLLPAVPRAAGLDFISMRRVWFVTQVAVFFWAAFAVARWVGGHAGQIAAWLVPPLYISVPTLLGLQLGNFQITALSLSMLAMLAFERQRTTAGAVALGFGAASKIFPGVLVLLLVAERRWRVVAWTATAAAGLACLGLVLFGLSPFRDFIQYQLPRIESGEAFFWIDDPDVPPINHSLYGLVTKLRALGASSLTRVVGSRVSSAYALLLIPIIAIAVRRLRAIRTAAMSDVAIRVRHVQTWLALLNLASFRSPFVPDAYAYVGTLWLLTWIVAERRWSWPALTGWIVLFVACATVIDGTLTVPIPGPIVAATLALQLAVLAANLYAIVRPATSHTEWPAEARLQLA